MQKQNDYTIIYLIGILLIFFGLRKTKKDIEDNSPATIEQPTGATVAGGGSGGGGGAAITLPQTNAYYLDKANQLHKAMKGIGTDEEIVLAISRTHTKHEKIKINDFFGVRDGSNLRQWFVSDFSGSELRDLLQLWKEII